MYARRMVLVGLSIIAVQFATIARGQTPLGPEFTYQGRLQQSGAPLNATADFQFKLFGVVSGGTQVGSTHSINNVTVANGLFTVQLNDANQFGATAFNGDKRFLEIAVRSPAGGGTFTTLTPRQPLTATPYALKTRGVDGHSLDAADGSPVDALFVDNSGNVGIGTSPTHPLHVRASQPLLNLQDSDSTGVQQTGYVRFADNTNTERAYVGFGSELDTDLTLRNLYGGGKTIISASNMVFAVNSNGGVGIGTTTPATLVHARGTAPVMILQDTASNANQAGYVGFWNASSVETGWMGYGTSGSPHLSVVNARPGGYIQLLPGAGGAVSVPVLEITGADLAEKFPASEKLEPGMVVAIDSKNAGKMCLARGAYNACVAGVVSGANNFSAGAILGNLPGHEDAPPIALSGRVYVWCDATTSAIEPGNLLTTSNTPGHAMKATDRERSHGAVIGKAMTSLKHGERGLVLVLVNLQ